MDSVLSDDDLVSSGRRRASTISQKTPQSLDRAANGVQRTVTLGKPGQHGDGGVTTPACSAGHKA